VSAWVAEHPKADRIRTPTQGWHCSRSLGGTALLSTGDADRGHGGPRGQRPRDRRVRRVAYSARSAWPVSRIRPGPQIGNPGCRLHAAPREPFLDI